MCFELSQLLLTREYIRAEEKFKERNAVERAVKTEIEAKSRVKKGVGNLGWFMSKDTNPSILTT